VKTSKTSKDVVKTSRDVVVETSKDIS